MTTQRKASAGIGSALQWLILVVGIIALAGAMIWWTQFRTTSVVVSVTLPSLSGEAASGQDAFERHCALCHGTRGEGSNNGPPLIHKVYEPSHHGDNSFRSAVQQGVRQHHWQFGDMPPRPDVSARDVEAIIVFVREVQRANGIF